MAGIATANTSANIAANIINFLMPSLPPCSGLHP
jgi:hypothetical protein